MHDIHAINTHAYIHIYIYTYIHTDIHKNGIIYMPNYFCTAPSNRRRWSLSRRIAWVSWARCSCWPRRTAWRPGPAWSEPGTWSLTTREYYSNMPWFFKCIHLYVHNIRTLHIYTYIYIHTHQICNIVYMFLYSDSILIHIYTYILSYIHTFQ